MKGTAWRRAAPAGSLQVTDPKRARAQPLSAGVVHPQPCALRHLLSMPGLNGRGNRESAAERTATEHSIGWMSRGPRCRPMSRAS